MWNELNFESSRKKSSKLLYFEIHFFILFLRELVSSLAHQPPIHQLGFGMIKASVGTFEYECQQWSTWSTWSDTCQSSRIPKQIGTWSPIRHRLIGSNVDCSGHSIPKKHSPLRALGQTLHWHDGQTSWYLCIWVYISDVCDRLIFLQ